MKLLRKKADKILSQLYEQLVVRPRLDHSPTASLSAWRVTNVGSLDHVAFVVSSGTARRDVHRMQLHVIPASTTLDY